MSGNQKPVVIITGASSGIGAATAAMLSATHRVVIAGRRKDQLTAVAKATSALPIVTDVTDYAQCERLVAKTIETYGRLDGLVLNAGMSRYGKLAEMDLENWDLVLRTNLTSAFMVARFAIPHLLDTKGAIVSVSSVSALRSAPGLSAYAASKAGMLMMTQGIARDYGSQGLRANVVCPGWIRTEMSEREMGEFSIQTGVDREQSFRRAVEHIPSRRVAHPDEAAGPICFLLSPQSSYINGSVLTVDGGATIVDVGTLIFG